MPEPPKPITPEIYEIIDRVRWDFVILALAVGLAVGAAAFYLFTERVTEGEASDA